MAHQDANGAWHSDNINDEQIISQESSGSPWAMNTKTGAAGLMQLMPHTANNPGFGITPVQDNSPMENRRVGTQYLDALYDYYHGDVDKALAAYNWGMGNVNNAVKEHGDAWRTILPDETRHYINNYHRGEGMNTPTIAQAEAVNSVQQNAQAFGTSYYTTPNGQDNTIAPVPVNGHFPTLAEIQAKYGSQNKVLLDNPTPMEQLEHLGETLLKTVGVAALAGFTGGIPVAIGLGACIKTHDKDKAYIKRRPQAEELLRAGYNPIAVRKWAETGDDKALVEDEKQRYTEYAAERAYGLDTRKENEAEKEFGITSRETNRHNLADEANTRRGQDITSQDAIRSDATTRRGQDLSYKAATEKASQKDRLNLMPVETDDGKTVMVDPTVHGSGANAFYQGVNANGQMFTVPVDSTHSTGSNATRAQNNQFLDDLDTIIGSDHLNLITDRILGGRGDIPAAADMNTSWNNQRPLYAAADELVGMQTSQGVSNAKNNGQSGVNTLGEINLARRGVANLDFTTPAALKTSAQRLKDEYLASHGLREMPNGDVVDVNGNVVRHSPVGRPVYEAKKDSSDLQKKYNY